MPLNWLFSVGKTTDLIYAYTREEIDSQFVRIAARVCRQVTGKLLSAGSQNEADEDPGGTAHVHICQH